MRHNIQNLYYSGLREKHFDVVETSASAFSMFSVEDK